MDLPRRVGDYTLQAELGEGAFGIVFKARRETKDKCIVAIKLLQNLRRNQKITERELAIVDQVLEHENIVMITEHFTVHDRGNPQVHIVMEFCEGGDLNDYVIKKKPDLKERFNLMVDMSRGVLYLHGQNIVHRDIKPENVLLTNPGGERFICKITDFGLSRIKEHRQEMFSTQCGTMAYIAPEILDGSPYSNSVDVFALGLLFFALFKLTIITINLAGKCLTPINIISRKKYDFMNSFLRNERPTESVFVDKYFNTSEDMGRLVYLMVVLDPDKRLVMDKVLIKIVEVKVKSDTQDQIRVMQDEQAALNAKINQHKQTIREQGATIQKLRKLCEKTPHRELPKLKNRRTRSRTHSNQEESAPPATNPERTHSSSSEHSFSSATDHVPELNQQGSPRRRHSSGDHTTGATPRIPHSPYDHTRRVSPRRQHSPEASPRLPYSPDYHDNAVSPRGRHSPGRQSPETSPRSPHRITRHPRRSSHSPSHDQTDSRGSDPAYLPIPPVPAAHLDHYSK